MYVGVDLFRKVDGIQHLEMEKIQVQNKIFFIVEEDIFDEQDRIDRSNRS